MSPFKRETQLAFSKDNGSFQDVQESQESFWRCLSFLPFEIFLLIIELVDMAALVELSLKASCLHDRIHQVPAWDTIYLKGEFSDALEALLDARSAGFFTLPEFATALRSTACALCQKSDGTATLLSLLHCRRVCQSCVNQVPEALPLKVEFVREIFGLNRTDIARIPVARIQFSPTDDQLDEVQNGSVSPTCPKHAPQWHSVVSLPSVAKAAAGKQCVSTDPKQWAKLCSKRVQRHLQDNYCKDARHSYCNTRCIVSQKLDLEPHNGIPVNIVGLYAAMRLHWAQRDLIARQAIVVPVPMLCQEDLTKIRHASTDTMAKWAVPQVQRNKIDQAKGTFLHYLFHLVTRGSISQTARS